MAAERITRHMNLQSLLQGIADAPAIPIGGISDDSRRLAAGDLFIACRGGTRHGLDFAADAAAAGVAAIAWDSSTGNPAMAAGGVPFVAVPDLAGQLGEIANRWYDRPSCQIDVIGVTGTNGKTTVAWLIAQALRQLGTAAGYIGTLGHGMDALRVDLGLTTPPCLELQARLAEFRDAGAGAAAIEVSSHGLDQGRLAGTRFDTAIFTNLSRDHIDYHGDMRAYGEIKARLFTDFEPRRGIVSLDSEFGLELAGRLGADVVTTSSRVGRVPGDGLHVFVSGSSATETGTRVFVESSWGRGELNVPMPGDFNVGNALQVLAFLLDRGVPFGEAAASIATLEAPPGRLQRVGSGDGPVVYVDYAHTPAALEAVLRALRPHAKGRIWCVFGCGGDRDRGKRPIMGRVVSRLADRAVITNDNPRGENPGSIIAEIQEAMTSDAFVIEDRAAAIGRAIAEAKPDDTVLIAGKGHEDYQIIGDRRLHFSDHDVALACLDLRRTGRRAGT